MLEKIDKTRKALDLLSESYRVCNIFGFGVGKKRELLNTARELVDEEIQDMEGNEELVRVHEFVSNAIQSWLDQVGSHNNPEKMHQLIQDENVNWTNAAEILEKLGGNDLLSKINGWRYQSEAELRRRTLHIEAACMSWEKAGKFFLEAGAKSIAADMYFNAAVFLDRTLERPRDAVQVYSGAAEEFSKSQDYDLAGELNRYAAMICFDLRSFKEASEYFLRSARMYRKKRNVIQFMYIGFYLFRLKSLEALYYAYERTLNKMKHTDLDETRYTKKKSVQVWSSSCSRRSLHSSLKPSPDQDHN